MIAEVLPLVFFSPSLIALVCLGAYIQRRVHRYRIRVWMDAQPSERKLAGHLMLFVIKDGAWSKQEGGKP